MNRKTKEHVVVGAIVSFVFVNLPGGPLLGGGVAGYLEDADLRAGARVGGLAGVVALAVSVALSVGGTPISEATDHGITHFLWIGLGSPALDGLLPLVVLPLVGGGIGAYIRRETTQ